MTLEKWESIIGNIKDNFKVEEQGNEHFDEHGGIDVEFIIFKGPLGKMKLEFITKPLVLDKKTFYSQRIGSKTQVEYIYSKDEKSRKFKAHKDEDGEWKEINEISL